LIFFSKVEDAFQISGRGCIIVPAIPGSNVNSRLRLHDSIQLCSPGGRVLETHIAGIEMVCGPEAKDRMAFLLPANVTKRHVPGGTEIWLLREAQTSQQPAMYRAFLSAQPRPIAVQ
jgi:hypothetical protein